MARPKFDPNRILLNELVITGAFVYDQGGFVRALELLASGKLANDLLVEQEDYPAQPAARHGARAARGDGRGEGDDRPARGVSRNKEHA